MGKPQKVDHGARMSFRKRARQQRNDRAAQGQSLGKITNSRIVTDIDGRTFTVRTKEGSGTKSAFSFSAERARNSLRPAFTAPVSAFRAHQARTGGYLIEGVG